MVEKSPRLPLGKRRREIEIPLHQPDIDIEGVMRFSAWRDRYYKKPVLDSLMGHYKFIPTEAGVQAYTRPDPINMVGAVAVGPESARALIEKRRELEAARVRQRIHIAETAELATALFWSVAVVRKTVLKEALAKVSENEQPDWEVAGYAADAIQDFGLCLESPIERDPTFVNGKGGKRMSKGLRTRLDQISPELGAHIVSFGAYAEKNREALRSADGVVLMQAALDEQDYRIDTWAPRHQAVTKVFPDLPQSREILQLQLSLPEMLAIQDGLTAA